MCELPPSFHGRGAAEQREALEGHVPLTGTKWDALLAAMVEQVAWLYGHERPAWVDEPERFLDTTWVVSANRVTRKNSLKHAPPAFRRHGAIPDPRDLDRRGGERFEWVPGNWSPCMTIPLTTPTPRAVRLTHEFVQWCDTLGSEQAAMDQLAAGREASVPGLSAHEKWWTWNADEMAAAVAHLERCGIPTPTPPPIRLQYEFRDWCATLGSVQAAADQVAAGREDGVPGLPAHDDWQSWNADEMTAAVAYLRRFLSGRASR